MDSLNGYYLLFTQLPFEYIELEDDREKQWLEIRHGNGLSIKIYKNHLDCVMARNEILTLLENRGT